jgi:hypothetical protein
MTGKIYASTAHIKATAPQHTRSHYIIRRSAFAKKNSKHTESNCRQGCKVCEFYKVKTIEFNNPQYTL